MNWLDVSHISDQFCFVAYQRQNEVLALNRFCLFLVIIKHSLQRGHTVEKTEALFC